MTHVVVDRKDIEKFIAAMQKEGRVFGPVRDNRGVLLGRLSAGSALELAYDNFTLPLKRMFFPQCEVMWRWSGDDMVEEPGNDVTTVIFGARPCDTKSLTQLDKVFSDEKFIDPYFAKRRENSLVISLACSSPAASCFCTSTGGGPAGKRGADIIAFALDNALLFEPVSEKGTAFLKKHEAVFRKPTAPELQERNKLQDDAEKQMSTFHASGVPERLDKDLDPQFWDTVAQTCLSCGACAYLCPTCHCFDLHDEPMKEGGVRVRVHDTCMFESFVREASGYNPRSTTGLRMKQRVMHKFSYAPGNLGEIFCVGCGRCVDSCPSGIDIRETISKVTA